MALKPGQKKCIETLDRAIVVAAGAGSGKTFTLTKRIAGALQSGFADDIGQICAITFTNKAAAELKSRVKAELRACGMVEQSLKVDDAWISTIHGMCARILRAHAVELDIDPAFKLATPSQEKLFMAEALDAVLEQAQALAGDAGLDSDGGQGVPASGMAEGTDALFGMPAGFAHEVSALFDEYTARSNGGFSRSTVEDMLLRLVDLAAGSLDGADAFEVRSCAVDPGECVRCVLEAVEALRTSAEEQKASAKRDEWLAQVAEACAAVERALAGAQVHDALSALAVLAPFKFSRSFGSKDFKAEVDACKLVLERSVMDLRLAAAERHLHTLVALAREVHARFLERKRLEGVLDNTDLLVLASRALEEHPDIAAAYADRFRLVMVDEFQDTDQMQVDMIKRLAGPDACRLCTVGDAQQSIYRFRGADVSVYRRHLESVRAGQADSVIELADNFRSHADILSLVDRVFALPSMFGSEFMSLAPGREEPQGRGRWQGMPRVQVQQVTRAAYKGVASSEVVEEQARQLAERFAAFKAEGHAASEMAVLLGRMANADVYAQALRRVGLACVVSGGSVFGQTPEAQMVLELARVAVNPADTEALWRVLSGPLFRVPDSELLALATTVDAADGRPKRRSLDAGLRALHGLHLRKEKGWDAAGGAAGKALAPTPAEEEDSALLAGASPQLALAVRVLGELLAGVGRSQLSRLLMRVVSDSGWATRLEQRGPEGLAAAANAYKAIRLLEEIEAREDVGPFGALRTLEETIELAKEAPGALSTEGGDFVRIMTIHASKGLEFPIVAVAEFPDKAGDSSPLLALSAEGRVLLSLDLGRSRKRLGGVVEECKPEGSLYPDLLEGFDSEAALEGLALQSSGVRLRAALYEHGRLGDAEEAKRLLYVALTRAKEALVVSMAGKRTKDNPAGVPQGCLGGFVGALSEGESGFSPGVAQCDFGGQAAALVSHTALVRDEGQDGARPGEAALSSDAASARDASDKCRSVDASEVLFMVPKPETWQRVFRTPDCPAHEGIFSYSSVAEASHRGNLLERLAKRFFVSCDVAAPDAAKPVSVAQQAPSYALAERGSWEDRLAAQGEDDDGSWTYLGADTRDADKATDFGTAFHRLAQRAVLGRVPGEPLAMPSASACERMARTCRVDSSQHARLMAALERWFGSREARKAADWPELKAELPFFIPVAAGGKGAPLSDKMVEQAFLEGEIDLLCLDMAAGRAFVIDYKTGGRADETEDELARKHVLQASCYALAVLSQGVQELEASFVRVERGCAGQLDQPQCIRYRFAAADLPYLQTYVAEAYRALGTS